MNRQTFICTHCGEEHSLDEVVWMNEEPICEDCALEDTVFCDCCGTRVWNDDSVSDINIRLCTNCFAQRYTCCTDCDRIIANSNAYFDENGEAFCNDCWEERTERTPIHAYNYRPAPIYYGDGPRYLGVELEIDGAGRDDYTAKEILQAANAKSRHLYIKTDGSLDDGMELVTHPMTLDYHMHQMPWEDVLAEARAQGYLSHQTDTCGLHVHISRDAFGETILDQECVIARLLYFIEKFWTEMLRFSRRTERQINRWAARYGMKLSPHEMLDCAKHSYAGRYMAVNLTNARTIEIRIFRGTLKLNTLLATLQMVNAICDVAFFMSDAELQALSWHDFLDRVHEPELIQYLKERNLYKNEPVTTEEDY